MAHSPIRCSDPTTPTLHRGNSGEEVINHQGLGQGGLSECWMLSVKTRLMTNPDSILKSRDITLPTKVRLVKTMVFPVVMYGCESWTIKKAEC